MTIIAISMIIAVLIGFILYLMGIKGKVEKEVAATKRERLRADKSESSLEEANAAVKSRQFTGEMTAQELSKLYVKILGKKQENSDG